MLGCAKILSEASWVSSLGVCLNNTWVWRSIHISAVAVSKELQNELS